MADYKGDDKWDVVEAERLSAAAPTLRELKEKIKQHVGECVVTKACGADGDIIEEYEIVNVKFWIRRKR